MNPTGEELRPAGRATPQFFLSGKVVNFQDDLEASFGAVH